MRGKFPHAVSDAANRIDEWGFKSLVDFFAQTGHRDIDHIGSGIEVGVPDVLADLGPREYPSRRSHQILQEGKLPLTEFDAQPRSQRLPSHEIEGEVADLEERVSGLARTPSNESLETDDEFFDKKGFCQVIIRAEIEAFEPFIQFVPCREQDHGDIEVAFAQSPENAEPVPTGQHDVQDNGVEFLSRRQHKGCVPVPAGFHGKTGLFEPFLSECGNFGLIFDDENTHDEKQGERRLRF